MDRIFPHTPYEEDQKFAHTILATHILHRAIPTGAALGLIFHPISLAIRSTAKRYEARSLAAQAQAQAQPNPAITTSSTTTATTATMRPTVALPPRPTLLLTAGRNVISTTVLLALYVPFYHMRGRDEIEWQDRAWRLLESRSQLNVDEWSLAGLVAGIGALAVAGRIRPTRTTLTTTAAPLKAVTRTPMMMQSFVRVAGAAGLGSLAACAAYCVWTYGIKGEQAASKELAQKPIVEQIVDAPATVAAEIIAAPVSELRGRIEK